MVTVLIPAYLPDRALVRVVTELAAVRPDWLVVVIDDGSGEAYAETFAEVRALGADVVHCATNQGKGAALKTGFAHIRRIAPGSSWSRPTPMVSTMPPT